MSDEGRLMDSAWSSLFGDNKRTLAADVRRTALASQEGLVVGLFLLLAVAFNLYHLYPEVAVQVPPLNDGVLHYVALGRSVEVLASGQDPTDFWLGSVGLGYPLFHHYQHLAYLPPAALHLLAFGRLSLLDLFNGTRYLLLSLFPLSVYWSMRRFGFSRLPAALGALLAPLLSTNGLYGFDLSSYLWSGYGLYTQLWGMFLLPPALAQGYATLKTGRGHFWAVLLLAATMMSHLVLGYLAFVSLALVALVIGSRAKKSTPARACMWRQGKRLVLLLALVALVTSYFWIPFLLDSPYMNRSVWEEPGKYDSYGHAWTLGALITGELFDFGRFPALTILVAIGLARCLWHWREERYRIPVTLFFSWLLLYFGRPTWGVLLNLLPLSRDLHLHRLIAGVHLGGIYLIGVGLGLPWQWALARRKVTYLLPPAALTVLLLVPVYRERAAYLAENGHWMRESQAAVAAEEGDIAALTEALRRLPPGRVYAGLGGNWGKDYKVGAIPVYALLNGQGLDTLGYLYHALSLNADVQVLFDESRPEHYDLFNVRYVVAPAERMFPEFVRPVQDFGRHRLYQVATSGYFDLVGSDVAFVGDKGNLYPAASHWLESDLPRVGQYPAVFLKDSTGDYQRFFPLSRARDVIPLEVSPPEPSRGHIVSETVEDSAYQAQVEVERESILLLKTTYHPNWHAYVDGIETDTVMLTPSYVGIKVSPGTHHVRLEYQPRPLRRRLFALGLLTLSLIALAERRRDKVARLSQLLDLKHILSPVGLGIRKVTSWGPCLAARERLAPHLPYLGGVALIALLTGLPLFQFKVMSGHDALEYLPRAIEFYQGLEAGELFPRWAPDLSTGYGQPFFNFNPPLFYYASAIFHTLGFSFVASQNLACFALLLLAGLGMYVLAQEVFGSRGGLVSAVAYLLSPYFLVTLYVRHALADFSAFAFIPLILWGLYRFATGGRYPFVWIGAISLALLLLSSNPISLITFPALLLLSVWLAYAERSWRVLLRSLWCLLVGLGLSAFFWLPALTEKDFVHTSHLLDGYLSYRHHFVHLHQLVHSPWGYGLSLPGPGDEMSFAVGPVHLFLAVVAVLLIGRIRAASRPRGSLVSFFLVLFLLAAFFTSYGSLFLWDRLPLLQYLEFPWRFLSLVPVGTAFVCGVPFLLLAPGKDQLATVLMGALIAGLFLFGFSHAKPETFLEVEDADFDPKAIATRDIAVTTAREYEPIWVRERPQTPATEPLTLTRGKGHVLSVRRSPTYYELHAQIVEEARIRVNTFYFPGWKLYVNGAERPIEYDDIQGVIEFSLEQGEYLVQVVFRGTPVRSWGTRLSLLALFLLLLTPRLPRTPRGDFSAWAFPIGSSGVSGTANRAGAMQKTRPKRRVYL